MKAAALLGMGSDGHTASLFPHTTALAETDRWVRFNTCIDAVPSDRVTMTYPLLNEARFIAIMVTGGEKAAMLQDRRRENVVAVFMNENDISYSVEEGFSLLLSGNGEVIQPTDGILKWYLDREACSAFASAESMDEL